jgi:hypothetical protein
MSHQLLPVQKAMKLMDLPDLGDRRPSQLLADLLQDCPPGEQGTAFFRGAFLKRLPAHIQVHLSQIDSMDLKELAQHADQLYLTHRRPCQWRRKTGRWRTVCCRPHLGSRRQRELLVSRPKGSCASWFRTAGCTTSSARRPAAVTTQASACGKTKWPGSGSGLRAARPHWPLGCIAMQHCK